jgi:hypothetical protein
MTFFDKKEDVFHIELTPHGRYLMSIGKLKPHHYKFFDDDIIYDSYAITPDTSELMGQAHQRILNETPKLKSNPNVTGVETNISLLKNNGITDFNQNRFDPLDDNINFLQRELGTSKNNSSQSIATKIDLFRGKLTSSTDLPLSKFLESTNTQNLNIPQINVEVAYDFKVETTDAVADLSYDDGTYFSSPYADGNLYVITPNNPIIRFKQENALDHRENFEIAAFLIESGSSSGQYYKPLNFVHRPKKVQNGLLVDDEDQADQTEITPDYVEFYFDLNVDKDIPQEDICATIGDLQVRNIYLDEQLKCPDTEVGAQFNIYSTRVGFDDIEDCD